jgi:hypothetical protein
MGAGVVDRGCVVVGAGVGIGAATGTVTAAIPATVALRGATPETAGMPCTVAFFAGKGRDAGGGGGVSSTR